MWLASQGVLLLVFGSGEVALGVSLVVVVVVGGVGGMVLRMKAVLEG